MKGLTSLELAHLELRTGLAPELTTSWLRLLLAVQNSDYHFSNQKIAAMKQVFLRAFTAEEESNAVGILSSRYGTSRSSRGRK